jgi:hypothetical protein
LNYLLDGYVTDVRMTILAVAHTRRIKETIVYWVSPSKRGSSPAVAVVGVLADTAAFPGQVHNRFLRRFLPHPGSLLSEKEVIRHARPHG